MTGTELLLTALLALLLTCGYLMHTQHRRDRPLVSPT